MLLDDLSETEDPDVDTDTLLPCNPEVPFTVPHLSQERPV